MSRLIDADELIKYIKFGKLEQVLVPTRKSLLIVSMSNRQFLMWIRLLANWKEINSLNQNVFYLMCIKDTMLD